LLLLLLSHYSVDKVFILAGLFLINNFQFLAFIQDTLILLFGCSSFIIADIAKVKEIFFIFLILKSFFFLIVDVILLLVKKLFKVVLK
jgi:hypothetical protein